MRTAAVDEQVAARHRPAALGVATAKQSRAARGSRHAARSPLRRTPVRVELRAMRGPGALISLCEAFSLLSASSESDIAGGELFGLITVVVDDVMMVVA